METPTQFGPFHLVSIFLTVLITFLLCKFYKPIDNSGKRERKVIVITAVIVTLFEIYNFTKTAKFDTCVFGRKRRYYRRFSVVCLSVPILLNTYVCRPFGSNIQKGQNPRKPLRLPFNLCSFCGRRGNCLYGRCFCSHNRN